MKNLRLLTLSIAALTATAHAQDFTAKVRQQVAAVKAEDQRGPFRADWNSLAAYRTPTWFQDAKFGIFIHWGVYSVPAFANEWYSRNIYVPGSPANKHQVETYGPLSKFGYKDFIPMFRAEKFNPNEWVELFASAGAKYVVPVAEHCDGFAMYDSAIHQLGRRKDGPAPRHRRRTRHRHPRPRPPLRSILPPRRALVVVRRRPHLRLRRQRPQPTPASTVPPPR